MVGKEITKGNIDGQILVPHSPFHQQGLKKVLKMGRKGLKMDRKGLKLGQKIPIFFKNRNGGNRGPPPPMRVLVAIGLYKYWCLHCRILGAQ